MPGPDIWGPHGWKFIHYITLGYPANPTKKDKQEYYDFFMNLSNVIPCSVCENHFKEHLKITPLDEEALSSKENLMAWGITMHNHVNARNNKKIHSVRDALRAIIENDDRCIIKKNEELKISSPDKFDNFTNNNNSTNNSMNNITLYLSISIIINVLLIFYLLYKNKIF
jgi:hypothetical protein